MLAVVESKELPVRDARAGDPDAWDTLFKRYQLPLYVYVREWIHHEQASLDVVQETFINAVRYLDRLQDDAKFGSWLFSIAHQKCVQHWRRSKQEEPLDLNDWEQELDEGPDPRDWLIRKEQEAAFMNALNQLPPIQRSVLLLHFLEDFSIAEIAEITGANPGTVKSRMHYAKHALRTLLKTEVP